jgi:putative FmdB family regulatory protein
MPIYEYKCHNCGREFEVFQGASDLPVEVCKYCGGPVLKLMSLSTFHLKGNGWYATDYGGKKAPATEKSESKPQESKPPAAADSASGNTPPAKEKQE